MLTDNDHVIAEVKYHFGIGIDQSFTAVLNRHDIDIIAAAQIGFDQVFPCQTWRHSDTHQADGIRQFDIIDDTVGNTLVSASTLQKEVKAELEKTNDVAAAAYLGVPYVWGGTSLTNGVDCSGFVMQVYAHYGISLPHSSSALRSVGRGISYSEAQPGDIICYSGHVAIYCGGNTIVHASNPSDGIKYTSPANYKSIIAVRRIF